MHNNRIHDRKVVIVNQAVNYLTIGIANEFALRFSDVALITGSVHEQGEQLDSRVDISLINKFTERSLYRKFINWFKALIKIYFLLLLKYRKYEVFYVTNPPMAYLLSIVLRHRCSVLMWDVYPDTLKIFKISERNLLYRLWAKANRFILPKFFRIYTIGDEVSTLISAYVNKVKIHIVPLWTTFNNFDPIPKSENYFIREHNLQNRFIVQYSGNIGITHNVEVLITIAEILKDNSTILFQIIGRGNRVAQIQKLITELQLKNCQLLPFQKDDVFPYSLSAADVGVVILEDMTSKGSMPSKTYNLMRAGKPILYIASDDSELNKYALHFKNGCCFHKSAIDDIVLFLNKVSSDPDYYNYLSNNSLKASENFTRENAAAIVAHYINEKPLPKIYNTIIES